VNNLNGQKELSTLIWFCSRVIPEYRLRETERICEFSVRKNHKNTSDPACIEGIAVCYLNATGLMKVADTKFDKEVAKKIYKSFTAIYINTIGYDPWSAVIDKAVDGCEFPKTPLMRNNTEDFYYCSNRYLLTHCATLESSDDCDLTLETFEKCNKKVPNCTVWPLEIMLPEFCCTCPELITNEIRADCRSQCKEKKTQMEVAQCIQGCLDKLNIKQNGIYNFDAIKELLIKNANKTMKWEQTIEKAVQACKAGIQHLNS
jgi:hypothetical protein